MKKREAVDFERVALPGMPGQQAIRNIIQDNRGDFWIATLNDNGLFRLNPATGAVEHFKHSASNSFGLSSNHVREFLVDKLNQLWIGTYNGLNKVDLNPPRFTFLQQEPGDMRPENQIYKAWTDHEGGLWFSTYEQRGFYAKKPGEKAQELDFLPFRSKPTQVENICFTTGGEAWIATSPNGILRYGQGQSQWLDGLTQAGDSLGLFGWFFMEEDFADPDFMWFSSKNGLCKLHKRTLKRTFFQPRQDIPTLRTNMIFNGMQTKDGHIYLLFESHFNGKLGRFDKRTGRFQLIETGRAFPDGKSTIHVRQFAAIPDGVIWMATAAGLGKFDPKSEAFTLLTTADGLADDNLMGIATDQQGNVWPKSLQNLSKYNPSLNSFWHFNVAKDMKEFNSVGATVGQDGRIFFCGNNGFYAFFPDAVQLDTTLPQVALTDFKVLNQSRHFGTAPELIRNITMGYRDNVFSFEFAALHFRDPKNNRYRYRMEGFDKNWVDAGAERKVTYTNLDAGRYTFKVMASNADGVWSAEPLVIRLRILPPPWRTWWAWCIYALGLGGVLFTFYRFQLNRRLEHAETLRLQELDAVKTRLYTNITHEFRTPLTVILGMARQALDNPKDYFRHGLEMIIRNGQNLLELVNQMLDLNKLESGKLALHYRQGDVVNFLKYLAESFHSLAESKDVQVHFLADFEELVMDFDAERLQQVVSNLLSNALKFTPAGGNVYFSIGAKQSPVAAQNSLVIKIKDTGIGISEEHLPHVFDRFYQVDDTHTRHGEGTGIGLALTKELVKLMEGEIFVKSTPGKGSEFSVTLPVRQTAPLTPEGEPPFPTPRLVLKGNLSSEITSELSDLSRLLSGPFRGLGGC